MIVTGENARTLTLHTIDVSRIELKLIFDEMDNIKNVRPIDYNDYLRKNLDQLEREGYFLLDAPVLEALLSQENYIPKAWGAITDSDSVPDATSGSIGFYGTHLQLLQGDTNPYILTPFFNRGHWEGGGHESLFFTEEQIAKFEQEPVTGIRRYAAVYK